MRTYDETIDFVLNHLRETGDHWSLVEFLDAPVIRRKSLSSFYEYTCPVVSACSDEGVWAMLIAKERGLDEAAVQDLIRAADNSFDDLRNQMLDTAGIAP